MRPRSLPILAATAALSAAGACAGVPATSAPSATRSVTTGQELVQQMHDRYAGKWYRTLKFTQATDRRTPADTMVRETWYEAAINPGRLRIDVGNPTAGDPVILWANDSTYIKRAGRPLVRRPGRNVLQVLGFDVYTQPVERTLAELRDEGFDLARVHQDTWEGRPAIVVGAAAGDTTSKQFWVDADRLVFVRMLEPAAGPRPATEVLFQRYQPAGGGWLAIEVTATANGKVVQHEAYSDVQVNIPLDSTRFAPAALEHP